MDPHEQARLVREAGTIVLHGARRLRRRFDELRWLCEDLQDALEDVDAVEAAFDTESLEAACLDAWKLIAEISAFLKP